jgi:hypothetical protein
LKLEFIRMFIYCITKIFLSSYEANAQSCFSYNLLTWSTLFFSEPIMSFLIDMLAKGFWFILYKFLFVSSSFLSSSYSQSKIGNLVFYMSFKLIFFMFYAFLLLLFSIVRLKSIDWYYFFYISYFNYRAVFPEWPVKSLL